MSVDANGVGLYDRDYMRDQGPSDRYHRTLRNQRQTSAPKPSAFPRILIIAAVAFFGLVVLPRLTIDGRHWSLWLI